MEVVVLPDGGVRKDQQKGARGAMKSCILFLTSKQSTKVAKGHRRQNRKEVARPVFS